MSTSFQSQPPTLPARRPSAEPLAAPLLPSTIPIGSLINPKAPPLPPRSSPSRPALPILHFSDDPPPNRDDPLTGVTFALTPASPTQAGPPVSAVQSPSGGSGEELSRPDSQHAQAELYQASSPSTLLPPPPLPARHSLSRSRSPPSTRPEQASQWPPTTDTSRPEASLNLPLILVKQWVNLLILVALILNLVYGRLSPIWILVLGAGYSLSNQVDFPAFLGKIDSAGLAAQPSGPNPAVDWVNHALAALFPVISTEVLTPFIDLFEDALMEQVPPIVTSVRLTSAALGHQPVVLTSLRSLTDQEWFAQISLSEQRSSAHRKGDIKTQKIPHKAVARSLSSKLKKTRSNGISRSISGSSTGSGVDSDDVTRQTAERQKRDKIVQAVSRRGSKDAAYIGDDGDTSNGGVEKPNKVLDKSLEDDDPDAGQYVNYQIGFEYVRSENTKKKGWGLHVVGYFGLGLKGVGKAEIPVYIDLLHLRGTANCRILLSATPPFVRTATVSLPSLPEFDLSAKPLTLGSFNAMRLPGMMTYIRASVTEVAEAFLRPKSYTVDIDRLLLGREAALRTHCVGVLHLIIHGAENLPKTDAVGSTDAYVAISFSKFNKPLYSTRTIIDTLDPSWEESAFILVTSDAIQSGEKLRLRLCDSDRLSADDAIGVVEADLADLVDQTNSSDGSLHRRRDEIKADQPGMHTSGCLEWSVRFCPLWQMSLEEMSRKIEHKRRTQDRDPADQTKPWWLEMIEGFVEKPDWEADRATRRKETLAWFTGEKERDEMEADTKPTDHLRSGVLQFHIHQCNDLELETLDGTFSSNLNARKSAASGKPALVDVTDRTPAEDPDPPSSYCEVHLNDRLIYRTRTKHYTPMPYFNAVSERFIRDWRMAKIAFVVRDDRDREHDPILGLVSMHLRDALADRSQFTRWFPLVGGLGWGRLRISLLWKPLDMQLPPRVSGYEIATLEIRSISASNVGKHTERNVSVILETETDGFELSSHGDDLDTNRSTGSFDRSHSPGSLSSIRTNDMTELEWDITRPIRLAVEYRHSCSLLVSFVTKSSVLKKKRVIGLAAIRLDDCPDGEEEHKTFPIFGTAVVKDAIHATRAYHALHDDGQPEMGRSPSHDEEPKLIGFVSISLILHPGISRAHRKMCKRDLRFKHVYEAWEAAKGVTHDKNHGSVGEIVRANKLDALDGYGDGDSDSSDGVESEKDYDRDDAMARGQRGREAVPGQAMIDDQNKEDDADFMPERKAHSKALHKRVGRAGSKHHNPANKGIFQLKIARTGKFVKDKIEAKLHSSKQGHHQGADLDVEFEGQSSL